MRRFFIALVLLAGPGSAFGQEVFDPGDSDLRIGQKVRVLIDGTCTSTPCPAELIKGKVAELSTSSLVIDDGRVRRDLAVTRIAFVERPRDPIWNGMLIGFAVGFTAGFLAVYEDDCTGWFCGFTGPGFAAAFGLMSGGIGAGVGALTDAVTTDRRIIFARSPAKAVPTVQSARGIGFSVRF